MPGHGMVDVTGLDSWRRLIGWGRLSDLTRSPPTCRYLAVCHLRQRAGHAAQGRRRVGHSTGVGLPPGTQGSSGIGGCLLRSSRVQQGHAGSAVLGLCLLPFSSCAECQLVRSANPLPATGCLLFCCAAAGRLHPWCCVGAVHVAFGGRGRWQLRRLLASPVDMLASHLCQALLRDHRRPLPLPLPPAAPAAATCVPAPRSSVQHSSTVCCRMPCCFPRLNCILACMCGHTPCVPSVVAQCASGSQQGGIGRAAAGIGNKKGYSSHVGRRVVAHSARLSSHVAPAASGPNIWGGGSIVRELELRSSSYERGLMAAAVAMRIAAAAITLPLLFSEELVELHELHQGMQSGPAK